MKASLTSALLIVGCFVRHCLYPLTFNFSNISHLRIKYLVYVCIVQIKFLFSFKYEFHLKLALKFISATTPGVETVVKYTYLKYQSWIYYHPSEG